MKALFFLRHYNDIDHVTPVIDKWIDSGYECDVVLVGFAKFSYDFRIDYLRTLDRVRVAHIRELLSPIDYMKWRLQMMLLTHNVQNIFLLGQLAKKLTEKYDKNKRAPLWHSVSDLLLKRSFSNYDQPGVIAFDWVEKTSVICVEWVQVIVVMARDRGLGAVSLPHGDSPHANQLIRRGDRRLGPDMQFSAAKIFNKMVVPNEFCAKRYRPFLDDQAIAVLGSPRYCKEWLPKLSRLLPATPLAQTKGRLKVVMFLRKSMFSTFWEEVREVVHIIAAFEDVELIIKPHTRGGWKQRLTRDSSIRKLNNVRIADHQMHSVHLMNWSDVIIDLATSVVFEAVRMKKPVLAADYLIAGRSVIAEYMPETELKCRDDVYQKIDGFLLNGCESFYVETHRQNFLREMLDVGGEDVLPRYVSLLASQAS